jgi:cholesterol oxidase
VVNKTASAHFIGGMPIAETAEEGVVDPYQRAFGYPGLHLMDGSVMPANLGVNPSLMIGRTGDVAVAEQGRRGPPAAPRLRLRPTEASDSARANRARRSTRRIPSQCEGEVIPLYPY